MERRFASKQTNIRRRKFSLSFAGLFVCDVNRNRSWSRSDFHVKGHPPPLASQGLWVSNGRSIAQEYPFEGSLAAQTTKRTSRSWPIDVFSPILLGEARGTLTRRPIRSLWPQGKRLGCEWPSETKESKIAPLSLEKTSKYWSRITKAKFASHQIKIRKPFRKFKNKMDEVRLAVKASGHTSYVELRRTSY